MHLPEIIHDGVKRAMSATTHFGLHDVHVSTPGTNPESLALCLPPESRPRLRVDLWHHQEPEELMLLVHVLDLTVVILTTQNSYTQRTAIRGVKTSLTSPCPHFGHSWVQQIPQRQLRISNQYPPGPLREYEPGASALQSDIKMARQCLFIARLVTIFSLSQDVSPHLPRPKRRKFHDAITNFWLLRVWDFRRCVNNRRLLRDKRRRGCPTGRDQPAEREARPLAHCERGGGRTPSPGFPENRRRLSSVCGAKKRPHIAWVDVKENAPHLACACVAWLP